MRKRLLIALLLLLILSTYNSNTNTDFYSRFNINKILIENNYILSKSEVEKNLSFLKDKNLFLLTSKDIEEQIKKDSFIESISIRKIYPNQIKVKIFEKKPLVILQHKKKNFIILTKVIL